VTEFWKSLALYTSLIALAIFTGGIVPTFKHWHQHRLPVLLSLGAGIMLGSGFFHLMPEAYEILGKSVGMYILLGFLFLYFIEKFITVHICEVLDCEVHHLGVAAFVGIAIHTLSNGIALGSGLLVPGLGVVVFLAVVAHKAPEAFSLTSVLMHSSLSRSKIIFVHLFTLSMIPLGAILAYYVVGTQNNALIGKALAFSTGTFLHISLSDLLPEVHKHSHSKYLSFAAFLFGLALMWFLGNYVVHV